MGNRSELCEPCGAARDEAREAVKRARTAETGRAGAARAALLACLRALHGGPPLLVFPHLPPPVAPAVGIEGGRFALLELE